MVNLNTTIEWTNATWSPVTGCTKVSLGCKHCYAERIFPRPYPDRAFTDVRTHPDRLEQPLRWRKPRKVFVNSMSDLFHEKIPDEFIDQVFAVMALTFRHSYQILTKRPERMHDYLSRLGKSFPRLAAACPVGWSLEFKGLPLVSWPLPNVWCGVSVENQTTLGRIDILRQTPATVRFLSLEPLLEDLYRIDLTGIHWVIVGGESGPGARPMHPDWVRSIRDQCQAAGAPFFMKQGSKNNWLDYKNFESFPSDLQIREFPLEQRP